MHKSILITTKIACLLFFVIFTFGCDNQAEPPQTPKVITQKITVSPPAQPALAKPPAPTPPAATPQPGTTQQKPPAKPQAPAKTMQPASVTQKPATTPDKKTAAVQPAPAPAPAEAKQTSVSGKISGKGAPAPPSQQKADSIATAKPEPDTSTAASNTDQTGAPDSESAATDAQDSESEASEADLKKLAADAANRYSPAGKVDPFLPLFEEKPVVPEETQDAEKQKKKRRMPLTPLERVDLSQLKLVGIIQAPSGNKALVEEASGKGYIIKKGTFIGIHAGRVLEIQKDRVIVEEEVENVLGQFTPEKKELKLLKPPGEF